ncbi:MAG: DNA methyltransferase [Clostridia bacterium]|nr:DNA methyltransferase [Clostridia bacterium]
MSVDIYTTDKKYDIIYADPPWKYGDDLGGGLVKNMTGWCPYPTMEPDEIKKLPVPRISASDCALLLWVTMPFLQDGLDVMRAWGFKYKTCAFCWVKLNPKSGTPFAGMGKWTMGNAELCLLGVKGHPHRIAKDVKQIVMSPRRKHSQKPHEVRERIVQLLGDRDRIELFARDVTDGWDVWGNEV